MPVLSRNSFATHFACAAVFLAFITCIVATPPAAYAQPTLKLRSIARLGTSIEARITVNCGGIPVYGMQLQDFSVFEDGFPVQNPVLWCPDQGIAYRVSVSLVFDCSGSMAGAPISAAIQAGLNFVANMDGVIDEACIVSFSDDAKLVQTMTTSKTLLSSGIAGLTTRAKTAAWDGCYEGISEVVRAGSNPSRAVILMTDGEDNASTHTPEQIIAFANLHSVPVFTISLGGQGVDVLRTIAESTNGRYYNSPTPNQLGVIYTDILSIMRQGMQTCSIIWPIGCADGATHTVRVDLNHFCGGSDSKTGTYTAALDTTTFSHAELSLGKVDGLQNTMIDVPLRLDNVPAQPFGRTTFRITLPDPALSFVSITTTGFLLDSIACTWAPVPGGVEITIPQGRRFTNTGVLAMLRFQLSNFPYNDTIVLSMDDWHSSIGCLFPSFSAGALYIHSAPVASITASGSTTLCDGDSVVLRASNGFTFYQWSPGGETTQSITVRQPGSYTFTGGLPGGGTRTPPPVVVTVNPLPLPVMAPLGPTTFCNGKSVTLDAGDFAAYRWSNGETTRLITVRNTGAYFVQVTNEYGCSSISAPVNVTVTPIDLEVTADGPLTRCKGDSVVLDAGPFYARYRWSNGDTTRRTVVRSSGVFTVDVTTSDGCTGVSLPMTVSIVASLEPVITASGASTFCSPDSVTLDAGPGFASYLWSTGDTTRRIVVRTTGNYTVTVTIASGCSGTSLPHVVTALQRPAPLISPPSASFCEGDSVTLDAGAGWKSYRWSTGAVTQRITVRTAGVYTVDVDATYGCTGTSVPVTVTVDARPAKPVITRNFDVLTSTPAAHYQWYKDGVPIPGATNQFLIANDTGRYAVEVYGLAIGCAAMSDAFDVAVLGVGDAPRAASFTVHPDPHNGVFVIEGAMSGAREATIRVIDLLGKTRAEYRVRPVDGRFRRVVDITAVPPGVYIVQVETGGASQMRKIVRK